MAQENWRELAEKATKEQDPEKLMAIVEELDGVLSQREAAARQLQKPQSCTSSELSRAELHLAASCGPAARCLTRHNE